MSELLSSNPFALAALGTMLSGWLIYQLRSLGKTAWIHFRSWFCIQLEISNQDYAFDYIAQWVSMQKHSKNTRNLLISSTWTGDFYFPHFVPGFGTHFFWHKGVLISYTLSKETETKSVISGLKETPRNINMMIFSRDRSFVESFIEDARQLSYSYYKDKVFIKHHKPSGWAETASIPKITNRAVLTSSMKEEAFERISLFLNSKEEYHSRGIPWRYGILIKGQPGTGKTTFVRDLAAHTETHIHILNISGQSSLGDALGAIKEKSIVLIEDVDAANSETHSRKQNDSTKPKEEATSITIEMVPSLSEILNALDGICTPEGVVFILTTNHPEKLDPALIRPGRIDLTLEFGRCTEEQAYRMYMKFFPNASLEEANIWAQQNIDILPAQAQEDLINMWKNQSHVIKDSF